ncbi:MAG: hypothetical protein ACE1S7_08855, partial [Candidatus Tisiphia sp.]
SPIELNAYEASLKDKDIETQSVLKAQQQKLERLSYQAKLAEAQFNLEILANNYPPYGVSKNYLTNNVKNFYAALLIKLLFIVKNVILYLYGLYGKVVIQQQRQLMFV